MGCISANVMECNPRYLGCAAPWAARWSAWPVPMQNSPRLGAGRRWAGPGGRRAPTVSSPPLVFRLWFFAFDV